MNRLAPPRASWRPITPLVLALAAFGCQEVTPAANARRVVTRTELIGGPSALGEVGDYLLENDHLRVIVQDKGFSRGFGVYGGSLIDIDRKRQAATGTSTGGFGRDQFGELFPVAFLQALVPDAVEVVADGRDGGAAVVRVSGSGGDFLSLTKSLNQAVLNSHELPPGLLDVLDPDNLDGAPQIGYEVLYELEPEARHVRIRVRLTNLTDETLAIPSPNGRLALQVLGINAATFDAPLGFVLLFGAGNHVFSPGFGYDIRFSLEDAYVQGEGLPFPALPGLLTNGLISTSRKGISYAFFTLPDDEVSNFAQGRLDPEGNRLYEAAYGVEIGSDTMVVPFVASSFTGAFYAQTPKSLEPGASTEYSAYMAVGTGDAASVMDVVYALRRERGDPATLAELFGQVIDEVTGEPVDDASVIVYDAAEKPVNQFYTDGFGRFRGTLPTGDYSARVERAPMLSAHQPFTLGAGGRFVQLVSPTPGQIAVRVRDEAGQPLPAKVTVVGTIAPARAGVPPRRHLFDLAAGQEWRTGDVIPDDPADPDTRRYIETVGYTGPDGKVRLDVPPDADWLVYISRGPEYSLARVPIRVGAGRIEHVVARLDRVVDTRGYVSADFHMHAAPSLDSSVSLADRVTSMIGEGIEVLTATDHNFITDYASTIAALGFDDWATSLVGLELTTLESGHFNGFPLKREVGRITRGAFEWSLRPPDELFTELRAHGLFSPAETIVQVNHARDTILGYFAQYGLDPLNGGVPEDTCGAGFDFSCALQPNGPAFRDADGMSTFSYDFDAIEILNGSIVGQLHHARMPADIRGRVIPEETRDALPEPGAILCDDGEVAFPGVIDDWFNLLNLGHRYIGTGTSDSHSATDSTGYARTWLRVDDDRPRLVTPRVVVDSLRARDVLMSNGPFVQLTVAGAPPGSDVAAVDGKIPLRVEIQAAPWIDVDEGIIWVNGVEVERFPVKLEDRRARHETELVLDRDAWVVVEVVGDGSMFPVVRPVDIPPVLLGDAFSTLAGPLGFGESAFGEIEPSRVGVFTPIALTNPVWIDTDGDADGDGAAWEAPGPLDRRCEGFGVVKGDGEGVEKRRTDPDEVVGAPRRPAIVDSFGFPRLYGDIEDVRTLFEQFGRHAH